MSLYLGKSAGGLGIIRSTSTDTGRDRRIDDALRPRRPTRPCGGRDRPPPATLSGARRGDSVIGLSGRRALLPWWLCWLNSGSLLSACERLLQGFKFTGQRRDVVGQPLNLGPIG